MSLDSLLLREKEEKEARVVLRYRWHLWVYVALATSVWLMTGALTGHEAAARQTSCALIALTFSLYAVLLLTHSRTDASWPAPTIPPDRNREWHEALDKSGSVTGLWVIVLTPLVAISAAGSPEMPSSIATTFVGIATIGSAYAALGDLRPALHRATDGVHRIPFIVGPGKTICWGLALVIVWGAAVAAGYFLTG